MLYKVIGLMSGSSLDGLDIVFVQLEESRSVWSYTIEAADCIVYNNEWKQKLINAKNLDAYNYMLLHTAYGKYAGDVVNNFIETFDLQHRVQLIASHGHTVFHAPQLNMTAQLGDGATIAAVTGINTVSDLRNMDVALNGQGAPIVPQGEKLLFPGYDFYLNIGGIANISYQNQHTFIAFDVCAANSILNRLAEKEGKLFDENGSIAASGTVNEDLLKRLNKLDYYHQPYPKSLANQYGSDVVFPLIESVQLKTSDALRTYIEHISTQIKNAVELLLADGNAETGKTHTLFITGGGAFNVFLINVLRAKLSSLHIDVTLPGKDVIQYKEALIMALLGVLRWREENTVLASVTGAYRSSIGGAVWVGQEA